MEQLLHRGSSISDLAYLRLLQLVHIQASNLVEDLKAYELPATRTLFDTEFRKSFGGSSIVTSGTSATVTTMLETAMEELFVPYTEGQRYLERESRSLGALYSGLLIHFTRYHVWFSSCSLVEALSLLNRPRLRKENHPFSTVWSIS